MEFFFSMDLVGLLAGISFIVFFIGLVANLFMKEAGGTLAEMVVFIWKYSFLVSVVSLIGQVIVFLKHA